MKLLTVKQAADRLGFHYKTVHKWTKKGLIKSVRVGTRAVRIKEEDLEEFIGGENAGD